MKEDILKPLFKLNEGAIFQAPPDIFAKYDNLKDERSMKYLIKCPQDENIKEEDFGKTDVTAVDLYSGKLYKFSSFSKVLPIQGYFIVEGYQR